MDKLDTNNKQMKTINILKDSQEIAEKCDYDAKLICELLLETLTDANFHQLKKKLEIIINDHFNL